MRLSARTDESSNWLKAPRNWALWFLCLLLIGGCGLPVIFRSFERPEGQILFLGHTTATEILNRYGTPNVDRIIASNEVSVRTIAYMQAYDLSDKPIREHVYATRTIRFFFKDNVLIGHYFASSWTSDSTDFDTEKVRQITKGVDTKEDVIRLLGRPSGIYAYPLIKERSGSALVYSYDDMATLKTGRVFDFKHLVVVLNSFGKVIDIELKLSRD